MEEKRQYLEYFDGAFDSTVADKMKPENKPYVAYSKTQGVAYTVIPEEPTSAYQMVDLGLPSGLKWADRNVGASSPEDYGLYFQWGDTVGYTAEQVKAGEKSFNWNSYFDTTDGGSTFNKYNGEGGLTVLESGDDAAYVNMGSSYRMPTIDEVRELVNNTIPTYIDLQGNEFTKEVVKNAIKSGDFKGIRLTGSNGNSIFLPAAGYHEYTLLADLGVSGACWSSSLQNYSSKYGQCLNFAHGGFWALQNRDRYIGRSVRGVQP